MARGKARVSSFALVLFDGKLNANPTSGRAITRRSYFASESIPSTGRIGSSKTFHDDSVRLLISNYLNTPVPLQSDGPNDEHPL